MDLFFLDSPLQYLNALEARDHYKVHRDDAVLMVLGDDAHASHRHLLNMLDPEEWCLIYKLGTLTPTAAHMTALRLHRLIRLHPNIDRIFLGHYREPFMRHLAHALTPNKVVCLDDGTATLAIAAYRLQSDTMSGPSAYVRGKGKAWAERHILGIRNQDLPCIEFFTAFDIQTRPPDTVTRNTYARLRDKTKSAKTLPYGYFLGSPHLEVVGITPEPYREILRTVWEKEKDTDTELIYIPHRRETESNLKQLREELGISVKQLSRPIECELAETNMLPTKLVSFFSTALVTCHQIFGHRLPVTSYVLPSPLFPSEARREYANRIYQYFRNNLANGSFSVQEIDLPHPQ